MARSARIIFPGYLYHVTQRGNNKQFIFNSDEDYILYLKYIEKYRQKSQVDIFAYCLMGNHVHFIVRPCSKDGLAKMFQLTHMRYAKYFQKKTDSSGHVWQGRFYSCLLCDQHLKEAVRYVELNPVAAGMVDKAWDYSWSSARAHLGKKYQWITLADIGKVMEAQHWKHYLLEHQDQGFLSQLRSATKKNLALGPESFILNLETKFGCKIIRKMGRPKIISR